MDISKIKSKLSEFTYKNELGEDCEQYSLVSVTDGSIGVLDRQDYNAYSFSCAMVGDDFVIDDTSKKLCTYTVIPAAEVDGIGFSMPNEVNTLKIMYQTQYKNEKEKAVDDAAKAFAEQYEAKFNELGASYQSLKAEYDAMQADYTRLREADESRKLEKHKAEVDAVLSEYAVKIGRNPKYLVYRAKVDYSKSVEDVKKDLVIIAGEAMMDKNTKQSFSYEPVEAGCAQPKFNERYSTENRYGNLLDKFKK